MRCSGSTAVSATIVSPVVCRPAGLPRRGGRAHDGFELATREGHQRPHRRRFGGWRSGRQVRRSAGSGPRWRPRSPLGSRAPTTGWTSAGLDVGATASGRCSSTSFTSRSEDLGVEVRFPVVLGRASVGIVLARGCAGRDRVIDRPPYRVHQAPMPWSVGRRSWSRTRRVILCVRSSRPGRNPLLALGGLRSIRESRRPTRARCSSR